MRQNKKSYLILRRWMSAHGYKPSLQAAECVLPGVAGILTRCWQVEPSARPPIADVYKMLHELYAVDTNLPPTTTARPAVDVGQLATDIDVERIVQELQGY